MKPLHTFVLFFLFSFSLQAQLTSCDDVPPSNPTIGEAWIGNGCESAILKVLSRPVRASDLNLLIWDYDPTWDTCEVDSSGTFCDPSIFAQGCKNTNYCPDKYCNQLTFFTEVKASMIFNAFESWGNLHMLQSGTSLWDAMHQIPVDINAKYDLANLRRPHIQAAIYENMAGQNLSSVQIPYWVVSTFDKSDPDFAAVKSLYDGSSGTPFFDTDNIVGPGGGVPEVDADIWDVTRIEARMWFYYLAKQYIDAGYTSLHTGQIGEWGRKDKYWPNGEGAQNNTPYLHTSRLMNMVRSYAQGQNKTVLISTENIEWRNQELGGAYDPLFEGDPDYPGAKKLIFDFDNVAMRVREHNDVCNLCDDPIMNDPLPLEAYEEYGFNSICDNHPLIAFVDSCTVARRRTVHGGISPLGCYYETVPYVGAFDFGNYVETETCEQNPNTPNTPSCGDGVLFNCFSDMAWFAEALDEPCKSDWLLKTICTISNRSKGYGNLMIPTSKRINSTRGYYFFSEEPQEVIDALKDAWEENSGNLDFTQNQECLDDLIDVDVECNGITLPPSGPFIFEKRTNRYTFNAIDPDCVSEYSWHIYGPNGWEPSSWGITRVFYPPVSGTYKVSLKQDEQNINGQVNNIDKFLDLKKYCCEIIENPHDPRGDFNDDGSFKSFTIDVYPSPFNSNLELNIQLLDAGLLDIKLYNSLGQEAVSLISQSVYNIGTYQKSFNVSKLPEGYYVLKATNINDNSMVVIPLVKGANTFQFAP